jgi:hypothetical protein
MQSTVQCKSQLMPGRFVIHKVRTGLSIAVLFFITQFAQASQPQITLEYSPRQDFFCSILPGGSIKEEWKAELLSRQPEFEKLWESERLRLLSATEAISGKAFPSQEITARLTLCNTPSESFAGMDRVSVNMRYALKSFTPTPVPMRYKAATLFHELLHIFLSRHPITDSSLLKAHAAEPDRVRNHLHLLALQKAVLLKLNEHETLKEVITIDSELPGGYYKRAWAIINAAEGEYLKYVAEISK